MGYELTLEDIQNSLKNDGVDISQFKPHQTGYLQIAANLADKYINKPVEQLGLPNLAAGILSAPQKLAVNVLNTPHAISSALGGPELPQASLPDWLNPSSAEGLGHSPVQNLMGIAGDIIGQGAGAGALYGKVAQALNMGAKSPLYARSILGGAIGGLTSDSEAPGGKLAGTVIGAALPAVLGLTKGTIGKRAQTIASDLEGQYQKSYKDILKKGSQLGSNKLRIPSTITNESEGVQKLFKSGERKLTSSIRQFEKNPTLENAHKAQSDLGKLKRKIETKRIKGQTLSSTEMDAEKEAATLQKRIRGSMQQHFVQNGRSDLATQYGNLTKGYAKDVVPFKGKMRHESPTKYAKELLKSDDFALTEASKQIPGYGVRKSLEDMPPFLKKLAAAGAIGAAGGAGLYLPREFSKALE